ncbi:MAG: OB-fold nucleic acid binding domain-containing protein, partial [Candidatus Paceibacterales bacterium]
MNRTSTEILVSPIEYLKGVGPHRAAMLRKELGIDTFGDLLELFPYRHVDKSVISSIAEINTTVDFVQVAGYLGKLQVLGEGKTKRLVTTLKDSTGTLQLIWFQGISWMEKNLNPGFRYRAYGRVGFFNGIAQLTHPEIESFDEIKPDAAPLQPIYPSTEKLKTKSLGGRQIAKLTQQLLSQLTDRDIPEFIPLEIRQKALLVSRFQAFQSIHFPDTPGIYQQASNRLKFE